MKKKTIILTLLLFCIIESSILICFFISRNANETALTSTNDVLIERIAQLEIKLHEELQMLNTNLDAVKLSTNAQFSATNKMSKTYGQILEEQQKQRVDTISRDTSLIEKKTLANTYYEAKKYKSAYELYSEILTYQADDTDVRFKKMSSLFYMNKMDSSKYKEILADCESLKAKGFSNPAINDIEQFIKLETKGEKND